MQIKENNIKKIRENITKFMPVLNKTDKKEDTKNWTPLFHAVANGHINIVKYLLKNKADVTLKNEQGWNAYHCAAYDGNLKILQTLIMHNNDYVNDGDKTNRTPLYYAVSEGHIEIVNYLLSNKADVSVKNHYGWNVYHCAAIKGNLELLQELIMHNNDYVNDVTIGNWSPLHHAVSEGHIEIVNYLLSNKADVSVKDEQGWNVYHRAANKGNFKILQELIMHNKDYINDVDKMNFTPLYHAVTKGHIEMVNFLLSNKADVSVKNDTGRKVYHCAANKGNLKLLQALIMHNNDYVNDVDKMNCTPLFYAVSNGHIDIANYLLSTKADVSVKDEQGWNVYHRAANKGNLKLLQELIMHNKDYINDVDKKNLTPLHHAVSEGHIEIVNYLLSNKADVSVKNNQGWNVYHIASNKGNLKILQELIMHNKDYINDVDQYNLTPLHHAVSEGHIEIVNYLLSNKADVSVKNDQGWNVYHRAANKGNLKLLQELIMHNKDYINDVDKMNLTPLYHAVTKGHIEMVNYLLSNKADVSVKNDQGWNVYHSAAYKGNLQILQELIMHNKDYINDVDQYNMTPLYHAVSEVHIEIVNYLLSNKADVSVKNDTGWKVYHCAANDGNLKILQELIMHNKDYINDVDKKNLTPLHHAVSEGHIEMVNYLLSIKADVSVKDDQGWNVYHRAANDGNLKILQELIMHNKDYINDVDKKNLTPLHHAVSEGHIEMVNYLLSIKADVSVKDDQGWNVYHRAANDGNLKILQELIMHNKDYINDVDKMNFTPLYHAVTKGHIEIVNYLLSNKADVSVKNDTGWKVYHFAANKGNLKLLQALIMHNNDYVNDGDDTNWTPLHHAVSEGHIEIVNYLLSIKADVSIRTDQGLNVYHRASNKGNLKLLQALIMHNNDYVNDVDKMNWTPLFHAVSKGHIDIVNYLLSNKADVSVKNDQDWNVYHRASNKGNLKLLQALIMHNNDYVNDGDDTNWTPLHHAVSEGHIEIVNYLLSIKADVSIRTDQGLNVYHRASNKGNLKLLQALIMHNNDYVNDVDKMNWTPLFHAVSKGHIDIVNYLLSNKADVSVKNDQGWNVYHRAANDGNLKILQELIMHNKDYINDVDKKNLTPLHHAVYKGHIEIVSYLLSNKADVSVKNDQGWNVYHRASNKGNLQILQALVMHNNDYVNDGDDTNYTPLYHAVSKGHIEIVNYLLSKKADVSVTTNQGWNVYHRAADYGNMKVMMALLESSCDLINGTNKAKETPLSIASNRGHKSLAYVIECAQLTKK